MFGKNRLWKLSISTLYLKGNDSKIKSLWITHELMRKIHKRNYLKRKATVGNDEMIWQQYKHARNETNSAIRLAKRQYIIHN